MSCSHQLMTKPAHHSDCIDDMEALLDHIDEFSEIIHSRENLNDNDFLEEYDLFRTYIK